MFGVRPAQPGYETIEIKPQPAGVNWARVTVPTPKGPVTVAYETIEDYLDLIVDPPANATATIYLPTPPDHASSAVYLDGKPTTASDLGTYLRIDAVTPGIHTASMTPGELPGVRSRLPVASSGLPRSTAGVEDDFEIVRVDHEPDEVE